MGLSIYVPASTGIIKELVAEKEVMNANMTIHSIYELRYILGAGLAGLCATKLAIKYAFLIGGSCFLLSGICDMLVRYRPSKREDTATLSLRSIAIDYRLPFTYLYEEGELMKIFITKVLLMVCMTLLPILLILLSKMYCTLMQHNLAT